MKVADEDWTTIRDFLEARDEAAFDRLYRKHAPRVWGLALRLTGGDEAEASELTQEAWVRALRRLAEFRGDSTLSTWLCAILVNSWREGRRQRGREIAWDGPLAEAIAAPRNHPGMILDVTRALDRLPDGYRTVLVLFGIYGYSHLEIASLLGITQSTSKSQLSRARSALRQLLAPPDGARA